jgi:hypothetical protein
VSDFDCILLGMILKHLTEANKSTTGSASHSRHSVVVSSQSSNEGIEGIATTSTSTSNSASALEEPLNKISKTSVFGYGISSGNNNRSQAETPSAQLTRYLGIISNDRCEDFDGEEARLKLFSEYKLLYPLFSRLFCIPATSAPVERIFSHSGIIMRPHRAKLSDELLEMLMFLKCNE